jgi:hypothetical protein
MNTEKKWEGDLLNRKKEGDFLINYLINKYNDDKNKSFVLNINAEWGYGKTFFLNNIANELKEKNHPVIEFDAWRNDYTKEPLLAFMSEVNNSLEKFFKPNQSKGKKLLKSLKVSGLPILMSILSRKLTGYTLDELIEEDKDEEFSKQKNENEEKIEERSDIESTVSSLTTKLTEYALKEHNTIKDSIVQFKLNMKKLLKYIDSLKSQKLPLFILIDELDRCRPNYAIELLESIKHLFDIEGIVFIIATDSKQLSHSINAVYGESFASEKYLKRFFEQEYSLVVPNNFEYIDSLFEQHSLKNDEVLFTPFLNEFTKDKCKHIMLMNMLVTKTDLNLREINHVMTILKAIRLNWNNNSTIHLPYLLFLIFLKVIDNSAFNEYRIHGDISSANKIFQKTRGEIKYETRIWRDHWHSVQKEENFIDLIKYYDDLKRTNIDSIRQNKTNNEVHRVVNHNYLENIQKVNSKESKYCLLSNYFDLVLYAGQIQ